MLPTPSLSFTLPSLHDDLGLDCRVFHPPGLTAQSPEAPRWGRDVAIVAHPYAPLGGSYDDPVVDVVAGTLLQVGFMVATFNFRGTSSGGRTSWTARPERADYMSVVGFMAYYASYLDVPSRIRDDDDGGGGGSTAPVLLQCGYSYGAMVTTKLPPLDAILSVFRSPAVHTAAADVRLRAQHLAEQQNRLFDTPLSPRRSLGMRVGGEGGSSPRGKSREARRSHSQEREDKIRKGVKDILGRTRLVRQKSSHMLHEQPEHVSDCIDQVDHLRPFGSAYLIVSPPIGFVTTLATMSFTNPFGSWSQKGAKGGGQSGTGETNVTPHSEEDQAERKLVQNPSLAVCGDQDHFVQLKKLRDWAARLKGQKGSRFQDFEVAGAGHFWVEEGVFRQLRDAVGNFAIGLLQR